MVFGHETLARRLRKINFQFPVGIRWCSDQRMGCGHTTPTASFNSLWELDGVRTPAGTLTVTEIRRVFFQFPVGIRWCSDMFLPYFLRWQLHFQFPLGIRWCSDRIVEGCARMCQNHFNSPWELDGVRTRNWQEVQAQ